MGKLSAGSLRPDRTCAYPQVLVPLMISNTSQGLGGAFALMLLIRYSKVIRAGSPFTPTPSFRKHVSFAVKEPRGSAEVQ